MMAKSWAMFVKVLIFLFCAEDGDASWHGQGDKS